LITHDEKTIICQVCEDLKNDLFVIGMKNQLKNKNQIQSLSSIMISSSSKMVYYIMMDYCMHLMDLLATKRDDSTTFHFGFNKIMELVF
jgi:hypothetical protein